MALAMTTNPVSGLPGFAHLKKMKGHKSSAVVVVQIQDFDEAIKYEQPYAEKALVLAIAARINIIAPDSVIHQGKDGTFAFLVGPDNDCNIALLDQQLRALFTLDIISLRELHDFKVLISIFDDLSQPVDIRLVLAVDRLGEPVFSGLRVV